MKTELEIDGLKCEGCINRIKNVLSEIKGITSYQISLEDKTLRIEAKKEKVLKEVIEKINNFGFIVK